MMYFNNVIRKQSSKESGMKNVTVTIDGVDYGSRCAAAKALVTAGKPLAEVAKAVGMKYQTVYAVTKGADKVAVRRNKYRAIRLATSKREYTLAEIARKVDMKPTTLRDMLKRKGVVPTGVKAKVKNAPAVVVPVVVVDAPAVA
jgi:predicted transcriptional regulator